MKLVNQTPAVADVVVTLGDDAAPRVGLMTAKLTFNVANGATAIDTQAPYPLFTEEEKTEVGLLPSDAVQRRDSVFEVIVIGSAHAPGGRPIEEMKVELRVGEVTRTIVVTGDRFWLPGSKRSVSKPIPFARMPLTFDRAFGGHCDVHLDMDTVVELRDPWNHHGRGFDPEGFAVEIAKVMRSPQGFPFLGNYVRMLPNLEHPEHRVTRWEDAPEPYCWSTVPRDIAFAHANDLRPLHMKSALKRDVFDPNEIDDTVLLRLHHRAHPDWIIDLPPEKTRVWTRGLTAAGAQSFEIPQVRVFADYVVGEREGSRELAPQTMVLLPDEQRLYIVYRTPFTVTTEPDMERSFRLRLAQGWFSYPQ